jgi:crotonobetainyl-CoA:carnitine CoA-transferase CaiB-like acyl-CoA transferase
MLSADVTYSQSDSYKVHSDATRDPLKYTYTTRDARLIQLMLLDPRPHWAPLCRMVGLESLIDDSRFTSTAERMRNAEVLTALLQERIGAHDWGDYWRERFEAWDAPWELIRTVYDVAVDPQVLANEMIFNMDLGNERIRVVAGPTAFDGRAAPAAPMRSPTMGQHTDELLHELGFTPEAVGAMKIKQIAQ